MADTDAWRAKADLVYGYVCERLTFDQDAHVMATDMSADFAKWMATKGQAPWPDNKFAERFGTNDMIQAANVEKRRISADGSLSRPNNSFEPAPKRYMAWVGVRFRDHLDKDHLRTPERTVAP